MAHEYSAAKKIATKTIIILAIVTILEVLVALTGKGYIIEGLHFTPWIMNLTMIAMSLYKAYLIVYEFMHMKYEAKGLKLSVVLPTCLLIWAVIAFLYEGHAWKNNRDTVTERSKVEVVE